MAFPEVAKALVDRLADRDMRIVFAESCTGGLISAELAKVPGVSEWLCGSAVTYRCSTKVEWLGVSCEAIDQYTAVSSQVAFQMATGVLEKTSEAAISASITGHFGPAAPDGFDGVVFIGVALRNTSGLPTVEVTRHQLGKKQRQQRQAEAAELVLRLISEKLAN
jgi:PncC family amidohydrolase